VTAGDRFRVDPQCLREDLDDRRGKRNGRATDRGKGSNSRYVIFGRNDFKNCISTAIECERSSKS
jgi:hypothetical protein